MISIDKMLMLTQGQGHKVKGQGQICNFVKIRVLAIYHQPMIAHWWCAIHRISIVNMLKLTKGQGQKVKGQGQTYKFVKKLVKLIKKINR